MGILHDATVETETDIQNRIRLAASKIGVRLFRNNVGVLQDKKGQHVRYGLCVGSADLIGYTNTGTFVAIEVKRPGKKPTPEQENFIAQVKKAGGIAGVAHSETEAIELIAEFYSRQQCQNETAAP